MRTRREMDEDGEDNPTKLVIDLATRIYGAIRAGRAYLSWHYALHCAAPVVGAAVGEDALAD